MNYAHYYSGAFSNGLMSRSTPLPLDPQPVEIHFEQVYDFDYCAPAESFGEARALIGDQRLLITVPMLYLRADARPPVAHASRSSRSDCAAKTPNGQHPADVQWYRDAGRTY